MLPRKKLLPLKSEFKRIRASGKMYDSRSFGMIVAYKGASNPQVAFIVSKKIDNRSVVRHEVKRKLSDAVAPFMERLPKGVEIVFLAKGKAAQSSAAEIQLEMKNIFKRASLL